MSAVAQTTADPRATSNTVADHLVVDVVDKSYGPVKALDGVSFSLRRGEMLALLGPSGCGKSTLLNVISGFLAADRGRILVDGKDVSAVPPHRRNMPMVFQSYALFPHMTVHDNVAFGLRQRRVPKQERARRVDEALDLVQLPGLQDRYPGELSGGQAQRVALARSLVIRPPVLLLDEPLSNLDAQLRTDMRDEMSEILRAAGTTSVFVTHDQSEGLAIADRVLVLCNGQVEQEGAPQEVYERPLSRFTADFTGISNLWPGRLQTVASAGAVVDTVLGPVTAAMPGRFSSGDDVVVAVRPDRVRLTLATADDKSHDAGVLACGQVSSSSYLGRQRRLRIDVGGHTVTADVDSDTAALEIGAQVRVSVDPRSCQLVRP